MKIPTHKVEINFFYMHYRDATELALNAEKEGSKLRSLYARHSILATVLAGEALISRLINEYSCLPNGGNYLDRIGVREKLFIAPLICGKEKPAGQTFDTGGQPFQKFAELVDIRNWFVHPKGGCFVEATADDDSTITIVRTGEEVPWVDTRHGKVWPQTRIPVNPFELTGAHARGALVVLDDIVKALKIKLPDIITDSWLNEIELLEKATGKKKRITTDSLWGGYTPSKD